jgi:hypothetical protein
MLPQSLARPDSGGTPRFAEFTATLEVSPSVY